MHREYIEKGPPARAQLLFVLSWFHAVLQERRTYIPQGWTKFYEFSPADLRSAADICDFAAGVAQGQPDWTTIHGLLMSAIYGGRVDNVQDERLLGCYLQQYFASATLNPGRAGGGAARLPARLPTSANHSDYVALIAGLPTQDKPDLFGLPANSDRAVQRRAAADVEANLRALGQGAEAAAGFDREKWSASLSPLLTLWQRLASTVEKVRSAAAPAAGGSGGNAADPVDAFVALELGKAKALLRIVDDSLAAIGRVVRGTELLGAETKAQGNALIKGEVPASWAKRWEGPERPDVWMRAAVRRIGAALEWHAAAGSGTLLQRPLRLADLLHPAFFLTALRQQTARARARADGLAPPRRRPRRRRPAARRRAPRPARRAPPPGRELRAAARPRADRRRRAHLLADAAALPRVGRRRRGRADVLGRQVDAPPPLPRPRARGPPRRAPPPVHRHREPVAPGGRRAVPELGRVGR